MQTMRSPCHIVDVVISQQLRLGSPFQQTGSLALGQEDTLFRATSRKKHLSAGYHHFGSIHSFIHHKLGTEHPYMSMLSHHIERMLFIVLHLIIDAALHLHLSAIIFLIGKRRMRHQRYLRSIRQIIRHYFRFSRKRHRLWLQKRIGSYGEEHQNRCSHSYPADATHA